MKKIILLVAFLATAHHAAAAQQSCEDPLKEVVAEAEIIAAADIARVAPPPGSWGSYIMSFQYVDYTGPEVLKGTLSDREFSAGYFLVEGGQLSDRREPRLSPDLFKAGMRQLVFIKKAKEGAYRYETSPPYPAPLTFMPSEVLCVLRAEPTTLEKVKEAVGSRAAPL